MNKKQLEQSLGLKARLDFDNKTSKLSFTLLLLIGLVFITGVAVATQTKITDKASTFGNVTIDFLSGGNKNIVYVAADGSGQYTNLKTAIDTEGSGSFYVKDGIYNFDSIKIRNGNDVSVYCQSWDTDLIGTNESGDDGIFYIDDGRLNIYNCDINGSNQANILTPMCLNARTSEDGRLYAENNYIHDCFYDGVYSKGTEIHVISNKIENVGRQGVSMVDGKNHVVMFNEITGTTNACINMENEAGRDLQNIRVAYNNVKDCGSSGIATGSTAGVREDIKITFNSIDGTGQYGIYVYNDTLGATVSNNNINNTNFECIHVQYSDRSVISGNVISNCGQEGITIKNTKYSEIIANTIETTDQYGIYEEGSLCSDNTFSSNNIKNSQQEGIYIVGDRTKLIGNTIIDIGNSTNLRYGILVNALVNSPELYLNTITDTRGALSGLDDGVLVQAGSDNCQLSMNTITGETSIKINESCTSKNKIGNLGDSNYFNDSSVFTQDSTFNGISTFNAATTFYDTVEIRDDIAILTLRGEGTSPSRDSKIQYKIASSSIMAMGIDDSDDSWKLCDGSSLVDSGCHIEVQDTTGQVIFGGAGITIDGTITAGGSVGINDASSYWLCTAADCSTKCQVTINDGIITGCT